MKELVENLQPLDEKFHQLYKKEKQKANLIETNLAGHMGLYTVETWPAIRAKLLSLDSCGISHRDGIVPEKKAKM